jgi:hypothetical protein
MVVINKERNPRGESNIVATMIGNLIGKIMNKTKTTNNAISNGDNDLKESKPFINIL